MPSPRAAASLPAASLQRGFGPSPVSARARAKHIGKYSPVLSCDRLDKGGTRGVLLRFARHHAGRNSMASKESKGQKQTVERVMHEFKHGELASSSGRKVKSRKQAVAIALSEAGASNRNTPEENKHNLARTKRRERKGETAQAQDEGRGAKAKSSRSSGRGGEKTRAELYAEAKRKKVAGRSKMSKDELARAVGA
jgi:hypothetical protein